jgi:hypothetical protein
MIQLKDFDIILNIKTKEVKYRDTISGQYLKEIEVIKGDYKSNRFNIYLVDGGQPYIIGDNNVEVVFQKYDGTVIVMDKTSEGLSIDENIIKVILSTNITTIAGRQVRGEVVIRGANNEILTSRANFYFRVQRGILTDEAIESANELPLLNQLIERVETLDKTVIDNETQRNLDFYDIVDTANTTKVGLDTSILDANNINNTLNNSVNQANQINDVLVENIPVGDKLKNDLVADIESANVIKNNLDGSIDSAITKKTELDGSISLANESKTNLDISTNTANNTKTLLDESIQAGGAVFTDVETLKGLRIHRGDIEPTDTPFWYDPTDSSTVIRK